MLIPIRRISAISFLELYILRRVIIEIIIIFITNNGGKNGKGKQVSAL